MRMLMPEDEDRIFRHTIVTILMLLLICAAFFGCTKTVYVPQEAVKVEYKDRTRVDSLVVRDSIYIREKQKGDTVYITEYQYKYIDHMVLKSDTVCKVDSVSVPYPVEVEVVKYKTRGFWKFFGWIGIMSLLFIIGFCIWKYRDKIWHFFS